MSATTAAVAVDIAAPPTAVYDLISDVTRMGEWSPECVRCEWMGEPGAVGSTFRGHNRRGPMRWSTTAEVVAATPGEEFAFTTKAGSRDSTRWRYRLTPADGGTRVEESFESVYTPPLVRAVEAVFMRNRHQQLEDGMRQTLARLKAAAERA